MKSLIYLSPDDTEDLFYEKLLSIPEQELDAIIERFDRYAHYATLLKFHRAVLRRPELNVQLKYNSPYGWHTSSCIRSLPEEIHIQGETCTCREDLANPLKFFYKLKMEYLFRCKLCKRFVPEWEEAAAIHKHTPQPD